MFAASASRTMANAKFKVSPQLPNPEPRVEVSPAEMREMREAQRKQEIEDAKQARLARALRGFSIGAQNQRVGRIILRICAALKVHPEEVMQDRRNGEAVMARQAIMYWAARLTKLSSSQIGHRLGKDHSTVLHGMRQYPEKRAKMGRYLRSAR